MANAIVGDLNCPGKLAPRPCCFRVMGTKLMNLHLPTAKRKIPLCRKRWGERAAPRRDGSVEVATLH